MRFKVITYLFALMPIVASADHACLDGHPMGIPIKRTRPLPSQWFFVGRSDITQPATHLKLKQHYAKQYVSGYDEGPVGTLCLKLGTSYIAVTTSDYGPSAEYSEAAPKCLACSSTNDPEKDFASGTGLRLGISKSEASKVLNVRIDSDLIDIAFEREETGGENKVLHSEILSLEFKGNRLVRFNVYDYREGA